LLCKSAGRHTRWKNIQYCIGISEFLIKEALISTVPWDDAGKYVRFSVTFEADSPEKEVEVIRELKNRIGRLKLRF